LTLIFATGVRRIVPSMRMHRFFNPVNFSSKSSDRRTTTVEQPVSRC